MILPNEHTKFMKRLLPIVVTLILSAVYCSRLAPSFAPPEAEPSKITPNIGATEPLTELATQAAFEESTPAPSTTRLSNTTTDRHALLVTVSHWFYYLGFEPDESTLDELIASSYDMVVIEPLVTEKESTDFPIANLVARLHYASHPKLVIAYIDIGQAEEWRTYWRPDWRIGDPDWIIATDPDGWEGNYPVAYWSQEWREIWLGEESYLQILLEADFDGIYLDWVEAYSDENVIEAAEQEGVDPLIEMKRWVSDLAAFTRAQKPDFLVIAQNAAELAEHDDYLAVIDAIAQEQVWFDGSADNHPPGDCPLPRNEVEVDSQEYVASLPSLCRIQYETYPESTLHMSSEWYLHYLTRARDRSLIIFTVDYATKPENVTWVYHTARRLGFVPFVSERNLDIYLEPVP